MHDNIVDHREQTSSEHIPELEQQFTTYLNQPRVPSATDLYGCQFPDVEPAAKKFLSAPPTSVSSEQLFSIAGQSYADCRSNLRGKNAEKVLSIRYSLVRIQLLTEITLFVSMLLTLMHQVNSCTGLSKHERHVYLTLNVL